MHGRACYSAREVDKLKVSAACPHTTRQIRGSAFFPFLTLSLALPDTQSWLQRQNCPHLVDARKPFASDNVSQNLHGPPSPRPPGCTLCPALCNVEWCVEDGCDPSCSKPLERWVHVSIQLSHHGKEDPVPHTVPPHGCREPVEECSWPLNPHNRGQAVQRPHVSVGLGLCASCLSAS